jgi:hypothetical protein
MYVLFIYYFVLLFASVWYAFFTAIWFLIINNNNSNSIELLDIYIYICMEKNLCLLREILLYSYSKEQSPSIEAKTS